ncbi:MAG: DoxX family membrane protein [Pseudomonadales bacterium]|nr:DoxX family membrane protein [Pseudomonadales bacterium]
MNSTTNTIADLYDRAVGLLVHFDGVASILLRLILAPVLIGAGWEKINGNNWFSQDLLPFPFSIVPVELSWFLASWTEFIGGICILFGLATRIWAVPLAVTMLVAAASVHWDNGWPAIAPSTPPKVCIQETDANSNSFERYIKCYNVNARTIEASERLTKAKSILREHGNYRYLNGSGSIVKLNSGIEFAAIYFAMLLGLLIIGGGRYFSIDYYLRRVFRS